MNQRREEFLKIANSPGTFSAKNGIRITDMGDGWAEGELQADENSLNPGNIVHGGCILTMMDQVAGVAANSRGEACVTLSCQASFLRATRPGLVKARGEVLHWGEDQILARVHIMDEAGQITARGTYTFQKTRIEFRQAE